MSTRPKVYIITRSIDRSGTSGSGHYFREIVQHLIPIAPDLDIRLAHYSKSDDELYRLVPELILPLNPLRAAAHLNAEGADLVHFSPLTIVSPINSLKAKTVATVHSAEPVLLPEAYSWIKRVHSRHLIPRYARRLDTLMTSSGTSKAWFSQNYRIPEEKIVVAYAACAPAFRRLPEEDRATPHPDDPQVPGPFIFHVSRFSERKNPWTMLEAFARLMKAVAAGNGFIAGVGPTFRPPQFLVLAGKGWDDPAVRDRARQLGIARRVITPGFVSEETVVRLLNRAELFWFPSLSEGFGMPNIEAMRCGCPVITSAVFAVPEIVGDAAIVLPEPRDASALVDATRRVLADPAERKRLIDAGLAWSARYSWDASARIMAEVYRRLLR